MTMSSLRVRVLFVLGLLAAIVVGPIIPANAAVPVVPAIDVTGLIVNECSDLDRVWWDPISGEVYGDQDGDLRLSGDDCNWK